MRSPGGCGVEPCEPGGIWKDPLSLATGPGHCAWSTCQNKGLQSWLVLHTSACPVQGDTASNPSPPPQPLLWMAVQHSPPPLSPQSTHQTEHKLPPSGSTKQRELLGPSATPQPSSHSSGRAAPREMPRDST